MQLDLSLELHRRHRLPTDYGTMRRVEQSFQKASRRSLDWGLRSSGHLVHVLPRWFRDDFVKMYSTRQGLPESSVGPTTTGSAKEIVANPPASPSHRWSEEQLQLLYSATLRDLKQATDQVVHFDSNAAHNLVSLVTDNDTPSAYFASSLHRHGAAANALQKAIARQSLFEEGMEKERGVELTERAPLRRIQHRLAADSPIA